MRAYEDMLGRIQDAEPRRSAEERPKPNGAAKVRQSGWRTVYEYIARQWPEGVPMDAMMSYAESIGAAISRQAIRAQTSTYTQKGSLERLAIGVYRITPKGAAELGMSLEEPTKNGTAAPNPSEENAADPTSHSADSGYAPAG